MRYRFDAPAHHTLEIGDEVIHGGEEFDYEGENPPDSRAQEVAESSQEASGGPESPEEVSDPSETDPAAQEGS